ncbi:MAG TPA: hypothetical protein VJ140_07795 [Actinomycetota bacterium]|nr:hypothetical protein [Actinomycetota bacterium]
MTERKSEMFDGMSLSARPCTCARLSGHANWCPAAPIDDIAALEPTLRALEAGLNRLLEQIDGQRAQVAGLRAERDEACELLRRAALVATTCDSGGCKLEQAEHDDLLVPDIGAFLGRVGKT